MKKILFAFAFVVIGVGFASSANAADCSVVVCGNGNPALIGMPWGLTGGETPTVASGTTIVDEMGVEDVCPSWYPSGCYDITKTSYYREQMLELGRILKAAGWSGGRFGGWIEAAQ